MASGGSFGSGFAGGALSTVMGAAMNGASNDLEKIGISGLGGGLGSMLGGGSFGQGFMNGATREMYNDLATDIKKLGNFNKWIDSLDQVKLDLTAMALAPEAPAGSAALMCLSWYKQTRYDIQSKDSVSQKILSTAFMVSGSWNYKDATFRVMSNLPGLTIDMSQ